MTNKPINFIQISDIHLNASRDKDLLGVKTQESFEAVLEHIKTNHDSIDFLLLTGDLSQDGSEKSYLRLAEMVKSFDLPIYFYPGNHDDSSVMNDVYPAGNLDSNKHIVLPEWQIILLDSHIHRKVEGFLAEDQLQFMETCLTARPDLHSIVSFHHQPVPVGSAWLDNLGVKNAEEFWSRAKKYPKLSTVIFGHVHQSFEQKVGHIQCYSPPSTCIQFMHQQDEFGLENLPPGYRKVTLHPDGKLETQVYRIDHYVGVFDKDAKGY